MWPPSWCPVRCSATKTTSRSSVTIPNVLTQRGAPAIAPPLDGALTSTLEPLGGGRSAIGESPCWLYFGQFIDTLCLRQGILYRTLVAYTRAVPKLWNDTIEAHRRDVRDAIVDKTAALVAQHGLRGV